MTFYDIIREYDWDEVRQSISDKTKDDVLAAINTPHRTLEDFKALISPAAAPFLEDMARESNRLTLERFGNTIQLYKAVVDKISAAIILQTYLDRPDRNR